MGMWDEYCLVCRGPPYALLFDELNDAEDDTDNVELAGKKTTTTTTEEYPQPNLADFTWLEEFVGITHKEEVIPLTSYSGYGTFSTASHGKYRSFDIGCRVEEDEGEKYGEDDAHGYACHVKCYELLQRDLNYSLRYQDVRPLLEESDYCALNTFKWSDYSGMAEYQDQGFSGETVLLKEGRLWMVRDPTTNTENAQRIFQLWRPLVESGFQRTTGAKCKIVNASELSSSSDATLHQPSVSDMPAST